NAAILRGRGISSGGPQLITPLCSPEKNIDEQSADQSEDESKVQRYPFRQAGDEVAEPRNMGTLTNLCRLHNRVARLFVMVLNEVTDESDADEVQHDRIDNFMRAE